MEKDIYLEEVYGQMPRLLGLLDRNIGSLTYGCFDRQYWHYRVVDFPCARMQEAVLTLALVYNLEAKDNPYFKNPLILSWINASLKFWCGMQERNGSFNEWYPHENSFVAGAFSLYAVSETLLVMECSLIKDYGVILKHVEKTADWLASKRESRALNQSAGAAVALYNAYLLTKNEIYLRASNSIFNFLKDNQNKEGWFAEYGGADIGYLSLAIDYLAKYYQKSNNPDTLQVLENSLSFIFNFIHPDLSFGGSYASRNTEYTIPSGFELLAAYSGRARAIIPLLRRAIARKKTITLSTLDDRYLAYLGYNYLQAFLVAQDLEDTRGENIPPEDVTYGDLGIKMKKGDNFYFAFNSRKGGAFKAVFNSNKSVEDWGVILESSKGKYYYSGWLNNNASYKEEEVSCVVNSSFQAIKKIVPGRFTFVLFRLTLLFLSVSQGLIMWLKERLRDILITRKSRTDISLTRRFQFNKEKITITDTINPANRIKSVIIGAKASFILVPSSCYFQERDLENGVFIFPQERAKETITIRREYDSSGNLLSINEI